MHQTEFQQKMLAKYGRTIVGMDATYKVCKWSFPFYLLTVVTNHGHAFPVAMFFMEHESGAGIAEALKILRSWNPDWKPAYIMVDKDAKEENAVNEVSSSDSNQPSQCADESQLFTGACCRRHDSVVV